jgi:hypothetical protein
VVLVTGIQVLAPINKTFLITTIKNLEHNIERHYEVEAEKNYVLQELPAEKEFFEDRLLHCLKMVDSVELENFLLDDFASDHARHTFEFLANSTFVSFFRSNLIDIPRCFKGTKSMRRHKNEIMLLKLNNYLMRGGKRYKTLNLLNSILSDHRSGIVNADSKRPLTDLN